MLLLPNHISYVDAVILQLACPRPIRFLVYDQIYQRALSALGPAPARGDSDQPEDRAHGHRDGGRTRWPAARWSASFPEGALTRTATLQKLNRGYELIARKARVPVMPVWLENVWGSIFSYYGGQFFWKLPRVVPLRVWIYFGAPISRRSATPEAVRRSPLRSVRGGFPGAARAAIARRLREPARPAQKILHAR